MYMCVYTYMHIYIYIYIYIYKVVKEVPVETIIYVDKYIEVLILRKLALIEP